ncbi:molybdopterin-guanine dinucleotide biosynthesis protein B [Thermodesulfatator indicus]
MVPVIAFIGCEERKEIIDKIAAELKECGYKIGLLKEVTFPRKQLAPLDVSAVARLYFGRLFLEQEVDNENFDYIITRIFDGYDIVIADGFAHVDRIPKFEVLKKGIYENSLKGKVSSLIASISDYPIENGKNFSLEEIKEITEFIEEHLIKAAREEISAVLYVNGRRIPLKKYVRKTLAGVIEGFVKPLKMTENAQNILIKVKINK